MTFKEHLLNMTEDEYRNLPAFSYSLAKAISEIGPDAIINKEDKKSRALEFGTLVDILLTNPENKDSIFHTKTVEKPTAQLLILAEALIQEAIIEEKSYEDVIDMNHILGTIDRMGLWANIKDENKIVEKFNNDLFYDYVEASISAVGKIVISQETLDKAEECVNILRTNIHTADYFMEVDGIDTLYQPMIVYKFMGVECKAKPDMVRINHNTKEITVIDIKTGSVLPSKFMDSFYEYKYYLQVLSYLLAVEYVRIKSEDMEDYKVQPFRFIYSSKKMPECPVVYKVPESLLDFYMNGWDGNEGFATILNKYKWYTENETYNIDYDVQKNNGHLKIELR